MARKPETKNYECKFTLAGGDEEPGTFTGYASIWDMVDSYGDVTKRGAFKKTLKEQKEFPMLWSHNVDTPIGVIGGVEDERGLFVTGRLNLDVARAREIRSLMAQGSVKGLSIGYNVVKELIDKETGVRELREINLWEISPCVFQACPEAEIDEVKAARQKDADKDKDSTPNEPGEPTRDVSGEAEPGTPTPSGEPQKAEPEVKEADGLPLLDEALATAKAISNLMEAK